MVLLHSRGVMVILPLQSYRDDLDLDIFNFMSSVVDPRNIFTLCFCFSPAVGTKRIWAAVVGDLFNIMFKYQGCIPVTVSGREWDFCSVKGLCVYTALGFEVESSENDCPPFQESVWTSALLVGTRFPFLPERFSRQIKTFIQDYVSSAEISYEQS